MIRGRKTRLRALERGDLAHFVRWINDPEVRRFMAMRYPLSMTEEEQWWEGLHERETDHIFAIEARDGNYIGNIGLHGIDSENSKALLGIIIGDKAYWGQGYGTDAVRAMLEPMKDVDWRTLMAVRSGGLDAKQLIAMAFRDLADNAEKVGNLNVSPELLHALLGGSEASEHGTGEADETGAGRSERGRKQ